MSNKKQKSPLDKYAGIEYHGLSGITKECVDAIMRLVQFNDRIIKARILSCKNSHCFLLTINVGDIVAIKSGFSSGYIGEGPRGFSYVIQLLEAYDVEIEEYEIKKTVMNRIDSSCLTKLDIKHIDCAKPVRPARYHDYVFENDWDLDDKGKIWCKFPYVLPLAIIDRRITDLAKSFWENPDEKLITGYRRLEDVVRKRCNVTEHSAKLFSIVFLNSPPKLIWKDIDDAEQKGRGTLFTSAYQAFRNPRAHKEMDFDMHDLVTEFLLLNHLYLLEGNSIDNSEAFNEIKTKNNKVV